MTVDRTAGDDATCPSCGEPVGTRATYCMHCGRDLPDRVEYDDVTGAPVGGRETGDAGVSLLERLSPGASRADASADRSGGADGTSPDVGRTDARLADAAIPSGQGTDGPRLIPASDRLDAPADAGRFLAGLGALGVAGVAWWGLSFPVAGAALAVVAWAGSVVSLARRRTGFDAMRYGLSGLVITLIFVSFALAYRAAGGVSVALALVPVAVAALFVAGFGRTAGGPVPD